VPRNKLLKCTAYNGCTPLMAFIDQINGHTLGIPSSSYAVVL